MAIRVYFSNNLGYLSERLALELAAERRERDPFQPSRIIVPNPNLKKWLQLRLAKAGGVAANLDFPFLEKGLWQSLGELGPQLDPAPEMLSQATLQLMIMSRLLQKDAEDDEDCLGPMRDYLLTAEGGQRPDTLRRAWQIAGRLAMLFLEYSYQRQEMVKAWQCCTLSRDAMKADAESRRMESCQQALYMEILGRDGVRDRWNQAHGTRTLMLPELADQVMGEIESGGIVQDDTPLHLFGLSQVSPFHRDLLLRLGAWRLIHIYQMTVCEEFWEDVTSPAEDRWLKRKSLPQLEVMPTDDGEELVGDPLENAILKWWGKPGRENLKLLSELEQQSTNHVAFESFWLPTTPGYRASPTVLEVIQRQILGRTGERPEPPLEQDRSLQIFGCPGIFREVETVHHSILANMREDPELLLTEIAVLVPDMGSYRPVIEAVFKGAEHFIPYNLSDSTAAEDSVYGQAVLALLDLAAGSFTRREVFELVMNPCFLAAARLTRQDALVWVRWAEALSVFHCLDQADKQRRGYADSPLYTWQQALVRLRLGRIMQPPTDDLFDEASTGTAWHGYIPYADMESGDSETLGTFCRVLENLFGGIRGLVQQQLDASAWRVRLLALLEQHLQPPPEMPAERQVQLGLHEGLGLLDDYAELMALQSGQRHQVLDLTLVTELIRGTLAGIPSRHGSYLSGGVNISSLRPMRPIPFKVVYVLGMGEGEFPGMAQPSTLDLRRRFRRIGDITTPEENRYLFLETLVSTRHKFYLSYVNRELTKDQLFHPCSVVNQVMSYVQQSVTGVPMRVEELPLHGHSDRFLEPLPAESDVRVSFSRYDRMICLAERYAGHLDQVPELQALMANPALQAPPPAKLASELPTRLHIQDLYRYLKDPADAAIRRHLRIYDDKLEDPLVDCDEPFFLQFSEKYRIVTGVLRHAVVQGQQQELDVAAIGLGLLRRSYYACKQRGQTPDGAFADYDRQQVEQVISERLDGGGRIKADHSLRTLTARLYEAEACNLVVLGETRGEVQPDLVFPAPVLQVEVAGKPCEIELHGEQQLVWRHQDAQSLQVLVITNANPGTKAHIDKHALAPFLFCLAAKLATRPNAAGQCAAEWIGCCRFTIYVASCTEIRSYNYDITDAQARVYLERLVGQLLDDQRYDMLPLEIINSATMRPDLVEADDPVSATAKAEYAAELASLCAEARPGSFSWTPPELVTLAQPEVPADAYDLVRQRFHLLQVDS